MDYYEDDDEDNYHLNKSNWLNSSSDMMDEVIMLEEPSELKQFT